MNLRHAAALALVGWYLMVPIVRDGKTQDVPLNQFKIVQSFDTAAECEVKLLAFRDRLSDDVKTLTKTEGKPVTSELKANMNKAFDASVCIASDDPRLKEK